MASETVREDRDLARRVAWVAAALAGILAGACGLVGGASQAAGALAGSAILLANFAGLEWMATRALRVARGSAGRVRALVWLGASAVRLGLVGAAFGVAAIQGWLGVSGLLLSLTVLPVTVVVVGLRAARTV